MMESALPVPINLSALKAIASFGFVGRWSYRLAILIRPSYVRRVEASLSSLQDSIRLVRAKYFPNNSGVFIGDRYGCLILSSSLCLVRDPNTSFVLFLG
jgi:hypothetical protein